MWLASELTVLYYPVFFCKAAMSMVPSLGTSAIKTTVEVADSLEVTEQRIYRFGAAKRIPGVKLGRAGWRFSRPDIDAWIKEQTTVNGPRNADKEH